MQFSLFTTVDISSGFDIITVNTGPIHNLKRPPYR